MIVNNHLCNCEFCKQKAVCTICGSANELHRAHIVPRSIIIGFLEDIKAKNEWLSFQGKNVFILCKKHHSQFDNFRLPHEELLLIKDHVLTRIREFCETVDNTIVGAQRKRLARWADKSNKMFFDGHPVIGFNYEPVGHVVEHELDL